jgi:anti-anti-sigma regulatory factor
MNYCFRHSGHLGLLTFLGDLTIDRIEELSEAIMVSANLVDHLVVSFEKLDELSPEYIQVLCSWHSRCQQLNKRMTLISSLSEDVKPVLENNDYANAIQCLTVCKQSCLWAE